MEREKVISTFEKWCDAMEDECPVICLDALELLKEYQQLQGWATGHGLVRCKDCKNWVNDGIIKSCKRHLGFGYFENWFCADGERSE